MEKLKFALVFISVGVVIGASVAVALVFIVGAKPSKIDVGPIEFKMPTDTAMSPPPVSEASTAGTPAVAEHPTLAPSPLVTSLPVSASPTPFSAFYDNFDNGVAPGWRILSGNPVVVNGRLMTASGELRMAVGDSKLTNYRVRFTYFVSISWDHELYLEIDNSLRFGFDFSEIRFYVRDGDQWHSVATKYNVRWEEGQVDLQVRPGAFTLSINEQPIFALNYNASSSGPVYLVLKGKHTQVDNFALTALP